MDANITAKHTAWNARARAELVAKLDLQAKAEDEAAIALTYMNDNFLEACYASAARSAESALTRFNSARQLLELGDRKAQNATNGQPVYREEYGLGLTEAEQGHAYLQEVLDRRKSLEQLRQNIPANVDTANYRFDAVVRNARQANLIDEVAVQAYVGAARETLRIVSSELRASRPNYLQIHSWLFGVSAKLSEVERRTNERSNLNLQRR